MSQAQKTPFSVAINNFVANKLDTYQEVLGSVLPCSVAAVEGSMVTVNFEVLPNDNIVLPQVTCPIAQSQYVRLPVQVGDFGICVQASTRLGGITGLGQGKAPLGLPANLGGLVFLPIGNTNWQTVDGNVVTIYGPNGVVIRDEGGNSGIEVTPSSVVVTAQQSLTLEVGGNSITINSSGINITGTLTINGHAYLAHEHSGVQPGSGNTGTVVP